MAVNTSLGATIKLSASVPATYDAAGYGALSYTKVGSVENIGPIGVSQEIITFTDLETGILQKFKGTKDGGSPPISIAQDTDDAGQILLAAALASQNAYSVLLTFPNGDKRYFMAMITGMPVTVGGANDIPMVECTFAVTGQSGGTIFVDVLV
jgi:hypothetical protein